MLNKRRKILNFVIPAATVAVILLLWTVAALAINSEYILPDVWQTLLAAVSLFKDKFFYLSLLSTLLRAGVSFIISFFIAFVFAFFAYKSETFKKSIAPFIKIIRALPTVAIVLLLLLWTSSKVAPVIVTLLVVLPTLYTDLCNAFGGIDKEAVEMCKAFAVPKKQILLKVEVPQVLPSALNSAGAGLSLNLKLMVAAEVIAQTAKSLGYILNVSKIYFEIPTMLATVVVTVIIGAAIESVFNALSKKAGKNL